MAGTGVAEGFDAAEFRSAIKLAMRLASPQAVLDKATFKWNKAQTFSKADPANRPYAWNVAPLTDTTPASVTLDEVAVEYNESKSAGTAVGTFDPSGAEITLLDEEYALVQGADQVVLSQTVWQITGFRKIALFSVDVIQLQLQKA